VSSGNGLGEWLIGQIRTDQDRDLVALSDPKIPSGRQFATVPIDDPKAVEQLRVQDLQERLEGSRSKLLIVELHGGPGEGECPVCLSETPCQTVRLLGLGYRLRDGWQGDWALGDDH
jgi:hypothetical protein